MSDKKKINNIKDKAPKNGTVVHARGSSNMFKGRRVERCVFKDGRFVAGGDFPIPAFDLIDVDLWAYENDLMEGRNHLTSADIEAAFQ
jgi:hypothetical protein